MMDTLPSWGPTKGGQPVAESKRAVSAGARGRYPPEQEGRSVDLVTGRA